jgi:hypothetical protein
MMSKISGMICCLLLALNAAAAGAEIWGVKSHDPVSGPPATLFHFPESAGPLTVVDVVRLAGVEVDVDGLAMDEAQNLYGFEVAGGVTSSRLLAISRTDATASAVGPVLQGRDIRGATFAPDGRLLALDAATDEILEFDLQTGTPVGPGIALQLDGEPFGVSNLVDLAATGDGGLVVARWNELYQLDAATGQLALLNRDEQSGPDGIGIGAAGLAVDLTGAGDVRLVVYDVQFDDDIYTYDPAAGFERQTLYTNILSYYNAGRGDLASAPFAIVGAGDGAPAAAGLALLGCHPNPFNPRTVVVFSLREAGPVNLAVYDLAGRRVRELAAGTYAAGRHEVVWDGCDDRGRAVSAGVYSCCARYGVQTAWTRMTLVE